MADKPNKFEVMYLLQKNRELNGFVFYEESNNRFYAIQEENSTIDGKIFELLDKYGYEVEQIQTHTKPCILAKPKE